MAKLAVKRFVRKFVKDEKGAALIEYSVLIGIITATVIALVISVGGWVNGQWVTLDNELKK